MKLTIPELAVVALVGPSGSGKSSFARKHFRATEVLSSDFCRRLVSDDENSQAATNDAFEVLHFIASKRLAAGKLVVIDATNVQPEARKPIVALAREYHSLPVAIVFDLPEKLCHERNRNRPDRNFGPHVVRQQSRQLRNALRLLEREGFRRVHILRSPEEVDAAEIVREPLWNNLKHEHGPFDVIGDVHGCFDELSDLLKQLGYTVDAKSNGDASGRFSVKVPQGRKAVFLGDLVDRGPEDPRGARFGDGYGGCGNSVVRARQSRYQADAQTSGQRCADHPRTCHSCQSFDELSDLLKQLDTPSTQNRTVMHQGAFQWKMPAGRKAMFLGDLVDHSPKIPGARFMVISTGGMREQRCACPAITISS